MECKQLDYFLTVCKEKSLSKAANKLFISQQGLSKAISNLEKELDVQLFIRSNNGVELTEFGESLVKHANLLLNQHDYIVSSIRQKKDLVNETLSIGLATGIFELLPKNFISDFIVRYPDAKIDIVSFTDDNCAQSILDYKINLGLCPGPVDLEFFDSLYSEQRKIKIAIGDCHPLAKKDKIYMKDLKKENLITINNKVGSQEKLLEHCKDNGLHPSIYLNIAEVGLMGELCSKGIAISFYAGKKDILPANVKVVDVEDLNIYWDFHLIVNKRTYLTDLAKEFIDYTKDKLCQNSLAHN